MARSDSPIIYQSNKLTEAKYEFSLLEKKAFMLIIKRVREQFVDSDTGQKDLFNRLFLKFTPGDVDMERGRASDIYTAMRSLRKREFYIDNEEFELSTGFIDKAKHYKKEGYFEIVVGEEILPYILDVAKQYTSYNFLVAMSFKSVYSVRFYEWINEWKAAGGFKLSIQELKSRLMVEEKYPLYGNLKSKVINIAQKEIKEAFRQNKCDLYFEYSEYKDGRNVAGLNIKIIIAPKQNTSAPSAQILKPLELLPTKVFNPITAVSDLYNDLKMMTENDSLVETKLKGIMGDAEKLEDLYNQIVATKAKYDLGSITNLKAYTEAILNKF